MYRFWSNTYSRHFFTISETNKNTLINDYGNIWTYEGIAFYAYADGTQPEWARPVHRFWSASLNSHFYTIDENEKNIVLGMGDTWTYEGVAWYAVAP